MAGGGSEPGERRGGRQKGTPNKATAEVRELALEYGPDAIRELARLSMEAASETARISAIGMLLDRGYGRALPSRTIQLDLPDVSTADGVAKAIAAVVHATALGEITPSEAGDVCGVLDAQRKAIELSDIEDAHGEPRSGTRSQAMTLRSRLQRLEGRSSEATQVFVAAIATQADELRSQARAEGRPSPLVMVTGEPAHAPAVNWGSLDALLSRTAEHGRHIHHERQHVARP